MVKPTCFRVRKVDLFISMTGKTMKKYIVPILLALFAMSGAVLEGLIKDLSPQIIQTNGLLTIICTGVLISWVLSLQVKGS
jgi:hypothetical protein